MEDPVESAHAYFQRGCNCAQAVLAALGPQCGLAPELCMQVAAAFGGGIARQGNICGAVTGALMLLGLKHGRSPIGDPTAKDAIYQLSEQFLQAFTASHGSIYCRDLLGYDLGTPDGRHIVKEQHLPKTRCPKYVEEAVSLFLKFA